MRLGRGARGLVRARVRVAAPAPVGAGPPGALRRCASRSPGESGYARASGCASCAGRGGRLLLNGQPLRLRGASLQEDAPGRGDALHRADMDAIVARLQAHRRQRHARASTR